MVAGFPEPVFLDFFVSQKLWAVDPYRRVPRYIDSGLGGRAGGRGGENLVFDFATATGQLRTSHLVGVEYGLLPGCVCRQDWF